MKHKANNLKTYIIFAPLVLISIAIIFLGALFLQGYDVGNAMPQTPGGNYIANTPSVEPTIDAIEIADTSKLPSNMPAVPTPARQAATHSMKHKEPATPQPARPLPPVAEAATSGTRPVNDAVHQAIQEQQSQNQTPPPPADPTPVTDPNAPVPEIPAPVTPPIAQ